MREDGLNERHGTATDRPESPSRFWLGFLAGWCIYFGINVSVALMESGPLAQGVRLSVLNTLSPMAVSAIVALNRRRLLRPEWSAGRVVAVQIAVGLAFAVSSTAILLGTVELFDMDVPELRAMPSGERFFRIGVGSAFLYVLFAGLMLWAESGARIRESHRRVAREAVLRAEAEAKAVRAQFNPHFVFNTLHSLMLLIRADPAAAEQAIEDVATLIRYASVLQRRDLDTVPLSKELEVSRRYLALEKLRLEDRLTLRWAIEVEPSTVSVPAFALQTLVENAVRHGVEPSEVGGTVNVSVRSADGMVEIEVRDDGVGAASGLEARAGHGLGLLRQRLANRYGDHGRIAWVTAPGQGFAASLRIPLEAPSRSAALEVIEERVHG